MASRFHRPRSWLARVTTWPSASAGRSASCTFRPRGSCVGGARSPPGHWKPCSRSPASRHPQTSGASRRCYARALDVVPGLGGVFGLPDGLRYQFGQRTVPAERRRDRRRGEVRGRYRGQDPLELQRQCRRLPVRHHAAGAPADCRLTALVAHSASASKFRAKLAADNATSADRWNTVTLATLHGAVIKAAADAPRIENATALLVLSLARLHLSQGSQPRRGDDPDEQQALIRRSWVRAPPVPRNIT